VAQLDLFAARPVVPKWTSLPKEVRDKVENKLAQLIQFRKPPAPLVRTQ
jgi:hypothetical protein